jgi:hypothetical protein
MEIRKSLTAIGAALMMLGANAYADMHQPVIDCGAPMDPNPDLIQSSLIDLSDYLRSTERDGATFGPWPYEEIWQKRGTGDFAVQDSLVRKLYEERNLDENTKPPKNKNNDNTGAAWDVRNGKYLAAVEKLDAFVNDAYKSRLNDWIYDNDDFENALGAKTYFVNSAIAARSCICKLTECE